MKKRYWHSTFGEIQVAVSLKGIISEITGRSTMASRTFLLTFRSTGCIPFIGLSLTSAFLTLLHVESPLHECLYFSDWSTLCVTINNGAGRMLTTNHS